MHKFVDILVKTLEYRDLYTRGHTHRGVFYALKIGESLGLSSKELEYLYVGGMLHDIGKIGIPDVVLLKPGKLTEEEFEIMKLHVILGYQMLKDLDVPSEALDIVLYHQEKYDGTGYPHGAKNGNIPLLARVYTIADSFEAMTSIRIYKKGKTWQQAFQELEELASIHFDPDIVRYAIKALESLSYVEANYSNINTEAEKIRWSFYYIDESGAIKGDLFLPTLKAFMEQRDSFCLTIFDIKNLAMINMEKGWEEGNQVLRRLIEAINIQYCISYNIKDLILKLIKENFVNIESPVVFRIGGDEFAVIAPYILPPEKVLGVVNSMKSIGINIDYLRVRFPEDFSTYKEVLEKIFAFTKLKLNTHL